MRIKRVCILLMIFCLFFSVTGSAADGAVSISSFTETDGLIEISGTGTEGDMTILLNITAPDGGIYHIRQMSTDETGAFCYKFMMKEEDGSGVYTLKITTLKNSDVTESQLTVFTKEEKAALLASINSAENAQDMDSALEGYYGTLFPEKNKTSYTVLAEQKPYESLIDAIELYKKADSLFLRINQINWSDYESFLNEGDNITNGEVLMHGDTAFAEYKLLSGTQPKAVMKLMAKYAPFSDLEALRNALKRAMEEYKTAQNKETSSSWQGGGGGTASPKVISKSGSAGNITVANTADLPKQGQAAQNPAAEGYADVGQDFWAREAIYSLLHKNILSMPEDGMFRPNDKITRAEFIKMLVESLGVLDKNADCGFSDTSPDAWEYPYLASASKKGITSGRPDGSFGVRDSISREDMAVMLTRAIGLAEPKGETAFTDSEQISEYAKKAVDSLYENGLISGMPDGSFAPKANASRAEAAVVIWRIEQQSAKGAAK